MRRGHGGKNKATGGVLIDVETGEIMLGGLAMPHSPRWHDGRLWMLNSGAGELLLVDPQQRPGARSYAGLPGYLRGLCFRGPYALVGLSKIRERHIFGGLPVQQRVRALLVRRGGGRRSRRPAGGAVRVHRRLRGTLRRAIFAGRPSPHDSQPPAARSASGDHQSRVVLLVAAEQGNSRFGRRREASSSAG